MTTQVLSELTSQETIKKWMRDGASRKDAIEAWEAITYHKLPDIVKNLIPWDVR